MGLSISVCVCVSAARGGLCSAWEGGTTVVVLQPRPVLGTGANRHQRTGAMRRRPIRSAVPVPARRMLPHARPAAVLWARWFYFVLWTGLPGAAVVRAAAWVAPFCLVSSVQ